MNGIQVELGIVELGLRCYLDKRINTGNIVLRNFRSSVEKKMTLDDKEICYFSLFFISSGVNSKLFFSTPFFLSKKEN